MRSKTVPQAKSYRQRWRAIEAEHGEFPEGYASEVNLTAEGWMRSSAQWLARGALLVIDYGFPQREYYHPQRLMGTLMCHFRHHAHSDPLWMTGLERHHRARRFFGDGRGSACLPAWTYSATPRRRTFC